MGLESFATLPSAYEFETACAHIDVQLESAANHQLDQPAANFIEETFNEIHPAAYWMCNIDMGTTSVNTSVMSWMNMVCDGENLLVHEAMEASLKMVFNTFQFSSTHKFRG